MTILACYAENVHPDSLASLHENAPDAIRIYVGNNIFGYWNAIASQWNSGNDLVLIEQDNDLPENALSSFAAARNPRVSPARTYSDQASFIVSAFCTG